MTARLFLEDAYRREADCTIIAAGPDGVILDQTPFYARSGGQPGDGGTLEWAGGRIQVGEALKGEGEQIRHQVAEGGMPDAGTVVHAAIDWNRRYPLMRMHTALHLICTLLPGAAVTGGQIGADRSRLDFDLPQSPDKEGLEAGFAALIAADHPVTAEWVDEAVLDSNPGLVRTLSVKPPRGTGRLRLVRIGGGPEPVDLQPCGGTHVRSTGEIGGIRVLKIENKGRQNRRIAIALAE